MKYPILSILFFFALTGFSQPFQYEFSNDIPVAEGEYRFPNGWSGGFNSAQFNTADLDGDGVEELILMDRNAGQVLIFQYEDDQYHYNPCFIDLLPDIGHDWAVFIDYDCDGLKDIFSHGNNGVNVYRNVSSGGSAEWELAEGPLKTVGFSGPINLVVNSSDIPAIRDIDGDGDLDILSYNFATGEDIRFHQNMSVERTGSCEELDYQIVDRYWGMFKECTCNEYVFGESALCSDLNAGRVAHTSGKFLFLKDMDGDDDQDLFLSHSDCDDLAYFENDGSGELADMNDFSNQFPNSENRIAFPVYPIINFLDLDFDGQEEMIASPHIDFDFTFLSDFSHSSWLYDSAAGEWSFVKNNFLQDSMLDLGELSKPQFLDFDQDGDEDLFIAYNGIEKSGKFFGGLALLENQGNIFEPEFLLIDRDFSNLSELSLHMPTSRFADFNKDGAPDAFYSGYNSSEGVIESYFIPGRVDGGLSFEVDNAEKLNVSLRLFEIPEFYDVDGDGDQDMITGSRDGSLSLYENLGNFNFELVSSDYLGVGRDFTLTKLNLWPEIADLDQDGKVDLVIADIKEISLYSDFLNHEGSEPHILMAYDSTDDMPSSFGLQTYNSLAFADLDGSGYHSLILGGSGGGLRFFKDLNQSGNGAEVEEITLYPNPLIERQALKLRSFSSGSITLYNIKGQKLMSAKIPGKSVSELETSEWQNGIYLLVFVSEEGHSQTKKFIISR